MHTLDWDAIAEQSLTATRHRAALRLQDEPDAAEEAFWAAEAARGDLAGAPDSLPCHSCPETPAPLRAVVALGLRPHRDLTTVQEDTMQPYTGSDARPW